jgi:hypothetical protein
MGSFDSSGKFLILVVFVEFVSEFFSLRASSKHLIVRQTLLSYSWLPHPTPLNYTH